MSRLRRAFSCSPVTIAVVVLALLVAAAVLFPLFARGRNGGEPACPANLKVLAIALIMYSDDYGGVLPPATHWTGALLPYHRDEQILVCPKAPGAPVGYALSPQLAGCALPGPPEDATALMLWDAAPGSVLPAFRHNEGLNAAFADGHWKWLSEREFLRLRSPAPSAPVAPAKASE